MSMTGKTTQVTELPLCDLCKHFNQPPEPAEYDGKTTLGPWGYMCEAHFQSHGIGLGLGRGQKLMKAE